MSPAIYQHEAIRDSFVNNYLKKGLIASFFVCLSVILLTVLALYSFLNTVQDFPVSAVIRFVLSIMVLSAIFFFVQRERSRRKKILKSISIMKYQVKLCYVDRIENKPQKEYLKDCISMILYEQLRNALGYLFIFLSARIAMRNQIFRVYVREYETNKIVDKPILLPRYYIEQFFSLYPPLLLIESESGIGIAFISKEEIQEDTEELQQQYDS